MGNKEKTNDASPFLINTDRLHSVKQFDEKRELTTELFENRRSRYNDKAIFIIPIARDVTFTLELGLYQDPKQIWGDQKQEAVSYLLGKHDSYDIRGRGTSYHMQYAVAVMPGFVGNLIKQIDIREPSPLFVKGTTALLKELEFQLERKETPLSVFNIRREEVETRQVNIVEPSQVSEALSGFKDIIKAALEVASSWNLIA